MTKANLEQKLSQISGQPIEITIRGTHSFTASFECIDAAATARLTSFFAPVSTCTVHVDEEIGTFVYIECER